MQRFVGWNGMLGRDADEDKFVKWTIFEAVRMSLITPTQTLIKLGYEPFPLSAGKTLMGKKSHFRPNVLGYAWQLAQSHPLGWSVLITGHEGGALGVIAYQCTIRAGTKYFHAYFGQSVNEGDDERDITDLESFRRAFYWAVRDSMVRTVAVVAARPFTVVCIRQIGQVVGGETTYHNLIQSIRLIITEEGIRGLFSGVIPQLAAELISVWGCAVVSLAVERVLAHTYDRGPNLNFNQALVDLQGPAYDRAEMKYWGAKRVFSFLTPQVVSYLSIPFSAVSTVMACAGTGLAVSFLPYNPTFSNWFEYSRGKWVYREHTGKVVVGSNKQMYVPDMH